MPPDISLFRAPIAGSLSGANDDGGETAFVPNLYYATQIDDQWFAGVGVNAPFGLATKYDDASVSSAS
ncbi:outer membrane protein transport protein [Thiolapillus sp.]|uniref:outer membrane protein transport protein n=1 Tax=Thiolapillus sp. TaxID=2017437 RepID=UPI00352E88EF